MILDRVERTFSVINRLLAIILTPLIAATVAGSASGAPRAVNDLDTRLAGYPQLTIRLTEERIEAPASVPAGPTLLIEENATNEPGHAFVFRIPDDVVTTNVKASLTGQGIVSETPPWFWRAEFFGNGDYAAPDQSAVSLVDLKPGHYIAGDPFRPPAEFAQFEVTANTDLRSPRLIEADVAVELFEMGIRLPETVSAGSHVWEITNAGAMLHEIALLPVPAGASKAEFETAVTTMLQAEMGADATKTRSVIDSLGSEWANWTGEVVAGMGVLSPQRTAWVQMALEPGTYGVVCYVPDSATGTPHLMFGMSDVFTVSATG
jgi:hypothetical protein